MSRATKREIARGSRKIYVASNGWDTSIVKKRSVNQIHSDKKKAKKDEYSEAKYSQHDKDTCKFGIFAKRGYKVYYYCETRKEAEEYLRTMKCKDSCEVREIIEW